MLAYLDHQCDLTVWFEEEEQLSGIKGRIFTGKLVKGLYPRYQIGELTLGVDSIFAKDHGNYRTGARFSRNRTYLDVRISEAAYADLIRQRIFSERYALRDGSKITIVPATHDDYRLGYQMLRDNLAFLQEHKAELEAFLAKER